MSRKVWNLIVTNGGLPDKTLRDAEIIFALAALVMGALTIGPWYDDSTNTTLNAFLGSRWYTTPLAFTIAGVLTLAGMALGKQRVQTTGLQILSLTALYAAVLRLITFGVYPIHWVPLLLIFLVGGRLYIYEELKD